jgi:hypothetical protein
LIWHSIIVQVRDDLRVAFGQASIARSAQALGGLNDIARCELQRNRFGVYVPRGVVDHDYLIRRAFQTGDSLQTIAQENRAIAGTDDNGYMGLKAPT